MRTGIKKIYKKHSSGIKKIYKKHSYIEHSKVELQKKDEIIAFLPQKRIFKICILLMSCIQRRKSCFQESYAPRYFLPFP